MYQKLLKRSHHFDEHFDSEMKFIDDIKALESQMVHENGAEDYFLRLKIQEFVISYFVLFSTSN
jgi:hypothetical protein